MLNRKKNSTVPAFTSGIRSAWHDLQNSQMLALEPRIVLDAAMAASVEHSSDPGESFSLPHHSEAEAGTINSLCDFDTVTAHDHDSLTDADGGLPPRKPLPWQKKTRPVLRMFWTARPRAFCSLTIAWILLI